ncbi:MAG: leucine-rich repeat domain-containing protein [Candidatus Poribacteria bacterium]|nr:leucine-rich repeat domain-containing protein [Candidatus Poribacteria bacterium]
MKEIYRPSLWFQLILASVVGILVYNTSVHAEDTEEWMPDPNLRQAVRETLALPAGTPLTKERMRQLRLLDASHKGIFDLTGLEFATALEKLHLRGNENQVTDLRPIANLTHLVNLRLSHNKKQPGYVPITNLDLQSLARLINLETLELAGHAISDITPLAGLKNLRELFLSRNQITDLTGVEFATNLSVLHIDMNPITDLRPLAPLIQLVELHFWHIPANPTNLDLRPLVKLTNLEVLSLEGNGISDISPLSNLKKLRALDLTRNHIEDIQPLAGLTQLHTLFIQRNPITDFTPLIGLSLTKLKYDGVEQPTGQTDLAAVWMPDAALRAAVRGDLGLLPGVPLTKEKLKRFSSLNVADKGISDLTGLEFATNLRVLHVSKNPITDLRPLAPLIQLVELHFWHIPANPTNLDLRPLAKLTNLEKLSLQGNGISDISPLAGLINLRQLHLVDNHIADVNPLAELTNLQGLWITRNWARDFSMLTHLNLTTFEREELCIIKPLGPSIVDRIASRNLPSVFQAWDPLIEPNNTKPIFPWDNEEIYTERLTRHDLHFSPFFELKWYTTPENPYYGLSTRLSGKLDRAKEIHQERLRQNPSMVFLAEVRLHNLVSLNALPSDSKFWLRSAGGENLKNSVPWDEYFLNILNPELQQHLIDRIIGIAECGLFDGVMLDGLFLHGAYYAGNVHIGREEEVIAAHANILKGVRERVRDDFLILVNGAITKLTHYTEYINGAFMEINPDYQNHYSDKLLRKIEDTLRWNEENFRYPQINSLCARGFGQYPPDAPENKRWMRLFTTLSLTCSDGYVLFPTGRAQFFNGFDEKGALIRNRKEHIWYDFWDAPLGQPVGGDETKGKTYEDINGLFIREFTNGWAVYNRSGMAQEIEFSEEVSGWDSGVKDQHRHTLADLDGEIYLKAETPPTADVNGDGIVNIQDLVIVANAFGEAEPDINGDGVVNIQDLVIVANAF